MKPHQIFSPDLDAKTLSDFYEGMKQPSVVQGALMPDAHVGKAVPIGSVIATLGTIFPSWVGVDIGCGVCAVPTTFRRDDVFANRFLLLDVIREAVPVGFRGHDKPTNWVYQGPRTKLADDLMKTVGAFQCHSLGGGNHFIELGYAEDDTVWIVIHSGSRNFGKRIADHYMALAAGNHSNHEWHHPLEVDSPEGRDYLMDMHYAMAYALENRLGMVRLIEGAVRKHVAGRVDFDRLINRTHNHAEEKVLPIPGGRGHQTVWIHRKGATHAEEGMLGVIPGNMADGAFIVRGKGNPASLFSSSHGAGRLMSRGEAKRGKIDAHGNVIVQPLSLPVFEADMAERGIAAVVNEATLDESRGAYKDIYQVLAHQEELVDVLWHVKPIVNVKDATPKPKKGKKGDQGVTEELSDIA